MHRSCCTIIRVRLLSEPVGIEQKKLPDFPAVFLYVENHSLGEWFKRRLMSIMGKEKLPLLYWKCGLRTAQASKGRAFENERRK